MMLEDYHQLLADRVTELSDKLGREVDYIEVGTCTGNSAEAVLQTGKVRHATLIDNWSYKSIPKADEISVRTRLAPYADKISILTGDSKKVMPRVMRSFDIGFVDGDHSVDYCFSDMTNIFLRLRVGGIMFVDDVKGHAELEPLARGFARDHSLSYTFHDVHEGLG